MMASRSCMKAFFSTIVLSFAAGLMNAEPIKVTGTLVSSWENESLMGAVVCVEDDTENLVLTDENGRFTIEVEPGSKLKFTYLAHYPKVVKVENDTLNVTLQMKEGIMDQVITTD